jgi:hypothetical protein
MQALAQVWCEYASAYLVNSRLLSSFQGSLLEALSSVLAMAALLMVAATGLRAE